DDDAHERWRHAPGLLTLFAFKAAMDFVGALADQEQTPDDQHEVTPRNLRANDGEERRREPDDPAEREEQQDAGDHGEREAGLAGLFALIRRQLAGEDRDEDDVVDAENDLEHRKRDKADPRLRVRQPFHCEVSWVEDPRKYSAHIPRSRHA